MRSYDGRFVPFVSKRVDPRKVLAVFKQRMEESRKLLDDKKGVNLKKYKVFYYGAQKWQRIKGKSVKKSPFGIWVNRKNVSRLIAFSHTAYENEYPVLICPL